MLLGSLGLTRGPGNNVIPEGLAIDEIPYIVNVPVASSDPQFYLCTLTWHHVFDYAVYPRDFTGWNEACQMTVFCCLAKRLCFIPSAFIVLRKNELVDVIITLKNCWEKSNFLSLIVFSNKLYIFWIFFSHHVSGVRILKGDGCLNKTFSPGISPRIQPPVITVAEMEVACYTRSNSGECWKWRAESSRLCRRCPHRLSACRTDYEEEIKAFLEHVSLIAGWRWEVNFMLSMATINYG